MLLLGLLLLIVLSFAKIGTLIWIYYQTRKLAALIYSTYLLINLPSYTGLIQQIVDSIQNNRVLLWLGATSTERISNFLFLTRFIPTAAETLLFIWLVLSLTRRNKSFIKNISR